MKNLSLALVMCVAAAPLVGMAQSQQPNQIPTNLPGTTTIVAPPASFNPLDASDEDLAYYGFPPRPDQTVDAAGYASWAKAMTASKSRIVPQLVQTSIAHGPARLPQNTNASDTETDSSKTSYNWSGYVSTTNAKSYGKSSFYYLISDYTVPFASQAFGACTGSWDYGSSWVGIDGWNTSDVLQAGIEFDAYCSGGSTSTFYSPWYEWYPYNEVRISNLPISPGDVYFVEVWNTTATQGYAYLVNESTNQSVEIGFTAPTGTKLIGNSAEWITERPGVNGSLATLTNYTADVYWDANAYSWAKGHFVPGGSNAFPVTMLDNNGKPISFPTKFTSSAFLMQDEGSAR
jgi:hypothetical protein